MIEIIKFYRIGDWIKNLGIVLIAWMLLPTYEANFLILSVFSVALLFSSAYSLNDYLDFTISGEDNQMSYLINKKKVNKMLIGLLCLFPSGFLFLLIYKNFDKMLLSLIFLFLFFIYSSTPFVFKKNLILRFLINIICIVVIPFLFVNMFISLVNLFFIIIFASHIFSTEIIHQVAHMDEDEKSGLNTLPMRIGIQSSLKMFIFTQLLLILFFSVILLNNFKDNSIFIITIVFSFFRILKILRIKKVVNVNFSKLRESLYGWQEGLFYLFYLLFLKFHLF